MFVINGSMLMLNFNHPFPSPALKHFLITIKLTPCPFLERKRNVTPDTEELA